MLQRSCWKIPKSAMTVVDADGNTVPAFGDVVTYDESPQFAYAMAAQWDRPDLVSAGGVREDLSQSNRRARFVRTTVRRPGVGQAPDRIMRVKASVVAQNDVVLEDDVPVVLFAGDQPEDVLPPSP